MRRRRAASPGTATNEVRAAPDGPEEPELAGRSQSFLKVRALKDVFARLCFVGIFITENMLHSYHFEAEIDGMVAPALAPLPREVGVCLHLVHIIFGLFGAIFIILSGFDTAGRTALTKGTSMMLVFMGSITWTWWINRQGVLYWDLDPYPFWDARCSAEKRNRTVHILKNISIVGALTMFQQIAKYEKQAMPTRPSFFEGLITSLRPWSFTSTLAPQFVALAVLRCYLHIELPGYFATFALLLALMAVQAAANLVNSFKDFERGIDTKETAGDRTLVDNLVSVGLLKALALLGLILWCSYFLWSVVATGFSPTVLGLALLGTVLALGYTAGPAPLKYMGLGDLAIFICFGPAVIAYSSTVLVGTWRWEAIAFTIPVTLYVIAILHANNYRDIEADSRTGAKTVAILLGPRLSLHYYDLLLTCAHLGALAAGYHYNCVGALASLLVLPQTVWLSFRIRRTATLKTQDEETAKTTLMFAVALSLGIMTMPGAEISRAGFFVTGLVVAVLKVFAD
eukprot:CAMPEP_0171178790 /NCGR_PEP_ID=MMETSP0790-20130122/12927_1 /TAXON_ID=2925 /ORGANISM="Alexandrium catenella, Strain OF101" /LENGTH=512 /DNA_ID=CAMNT_0011643711 /DNA_START=69 /DNA_END=1607 /DNA_ORIENTATION=+